MDVGQICIKTKGKEAGRTVVVLTKPKEGKVLIDGPKVKRKTCNILHLFPVGKEIKVNEEASHDEVMKALK